MAYESPTAVVPAALGTAAVGVSPAYSRSDHVHPTTGLPGLDTANTWTQKQTFNPAANGDIPLKIAPDAGATPPATAAVGDVWVGSDGLIYYCYYADAWSQFQRVQKYTYTLTDNVAATDVDATNLIWSDALHGVIIDYILWRGATPDVETGRLLLAFGGLGVPQCDQTSVTTVVDPGVTFTAVLVAGDIFLRYATTNTGFNATCKMTLVEVW